MVVIEKAETEDKLPGSPQELDPTERVGICAQ